VDSQDVEPKDFKVADKAFTDSGYRMRSLLKSMTESEDFFRATPPVAKSTKLASQ